MVAFWHGVLGYLLRLYAEIYPHRLTGTRGLLSQPPRPTVDPAFEPRTASAISGALAGTVTAALCSEFHRAQFSLFSRLIKYRASYKRNPWVFRGRSSRTLYTDDRGPSPATQWTPSLNSCRYPPGDWTGGRHAHPTSQEAEPDQKA